MKKTVRIHYIFKPFLRFWYLDSNIVELLLKINNKEILLSNIVNLVKNLLNNINSYNTKDPFYEYSVNIRSNIIMGILEVWVSNNKNIAPDTLSIQVIKHLSQSMKFKVDLETNE